MALSLSLRAFVFLKELVSESGCSLREEDTGTCFHFECFTAPQNYWQSEYFSLLWCNGHGIYTKGWWNLCQAHH
jgi:hypothetical protein